MAETKEETPQSSPAENLAASQLEHFSALGDKILERSDLAAKTLAGLGSSAISAIGIVKVTDVYPLEGPCGWLFGLFGGFALMAASFAFFTRRLWLLQTAIVMRSTPQEISEIRGDQKEIELVRQVYGEIAKLNDIESLRAYEARSHRLWRVADHVGEEKRAESLRAQAKQIELEVRATMARARLNLLRRRATRSILGVRAFVVYFAFLSGLILFGVAADELESKRSGEISLAKSCGEANEAGAKELPGACEEYVPSPPPPTSDEKESSAEEAIGTSLEALIGARKTCRTDAQDAGLDPEICEPINRAIAALIAGQPGPADP